MKNNTTYNTQSKEDLGLLSAETQISKEDLNMLFTKMKEAKENAYCPYSKFRVGACILTSSNSFIVGNNVENISYGLSICAERNAICSAICQGIKHEDFYAIAVTTDRDDYLSPCGACRQFLAEFPSFKHVFLVNKSGYTKITNVDELIPFVFKTEL